MMGIDWALGMVSFGRYWDAQAVRNKFGEVIAGGMLTEAGHWV